MKRKILLALLAICCAAQTWAMVSPDGVQTPQKNSEVQMGNRTEPDYLTITATSDNTRIYLVVHGSPNLSTFQYSYNDGVTWTNITKTTTFNTLQNEQCIKFRSSNQVTKNDVDYINFADNTNCSYKVSGNINTLIDYNAVENVCIGDSCFYRLFYGCKGLTDASELSLPAYSLTDWCYYFMFGSCTNLTAAPELPADILADCCYAGMFKYCQSLCTAPVLHATNLAPACYGAMFKGCISLNEAPALPATTLAEECYSSMFYDCISLIEAPALPATILAEECYSSMFYRCTSLTEAPVLPAATLAERCYFSMFNGCTSLTEAPALIATTLAAGCYYRMFSGCTSLTEAPALPATTLTIQCYEDMFWGCTSLTEAPVLPATTLASCCYIKMFENCTSLTSVTTHATTWNTSDAAGWLWGVATTGDFYNLGGADIPTGTSGIPTGWTEHGPRVKTITAVPNDENYGTVTGNGSYLINETCSLTATPNPGYTFVNWTENDFEVSTDAEYGFTVEGDRSLVANFIVTPDYLTLTALEDNTIIGLGVIGSPNISTLQYSYDDENWNNLTNSLTFNTLQNGQYIKFRSENQVSNGSDDYISFKDESGSYKVSGNMSSLINYMDVDNVVLGDYAFNNLFYGCMHLIDASSLSLPATTLTYNCCYYMFRGCTSLTKAPELPATTLANRCYKYMFYDCTSLVEAPELPATTLGFECYYCMFYGCTSLVEAPELPATTLAYSCYQAMFGGCTSLVEAPELPATTLAICCYDAMFGGCTSLAEAPELPATTLASCCYDAMFSGCTSLAEAPELPATTLDVFCYSDMFRDCISLTEAPELPATTLAPFCYNGMFSGCTSLNSVTTHAMTWNTSYAEDWLYGVSPTGHFYNLGGADIPTGVSGIPEGWTEHNPNLKTITAVPNDENYGTVTGNGSYLINETCTLTATPNTGYTFINWTENDIEVSTDAEYSFTVENDRNLVANFAIQTFEVIASANNSDYGTVTGGGTFDFGTTATLTVTPNTHYTFVNWTENDEVVSTDAEYSFTVESDRNLVANFEVAIDYLTLTALEDNTIVGLNINGTPNISTLQYSYDGVNWNAITESITFNTLQNGQYIKFRSENQVSNNESSYINFYDESGSYKVSGNVNTLINYNDVDNVVLGGYAFYNLFSGCTHLTDASSLSLPSVVLSHACYQGMFMGCTSLTEAPELPAMDLGPGCYYGMFNGCTSLTEAPELPATTLANACYWNMFYGCTSLVSAPALPATTLASYCYSGMFCNCTSLTSVPELPATTMAEGCYQDMFGRCSNIVSAPELPATTLANYCYKHMFHYCTSLTEAPELPAISLANYCYQCMFSCCTSLISVSALPATIMADYCYSGMFENCASLTTAPELTVMTTANNCCSQMFFLCTGLTDASGISLPATTLADYCYKNMFSDCISLLSTPELPAMTLADYCYCSMFFGCKSLTEAPALPATIMADYCYSSMFSGCSNITTAPALPATTLAESCYQSMFYNCLNLNSTVSLPATTMANSCYCNMFFCCHSLKTVTTHATAWNPEYATDWLYAAPSTGDFYNLGGADIPRGASGIPEGWTEHKPNFIDYLTLTATSDNTVIGLDTIGSPNISTLQYSYDGVNWNNVTEPITFNTLQNGEYIKFRSENQVCTANFGSSDYIHHYIQFKDEDGSYKASGNMNTLIDYQDVDNVELGIFAFYKMFQDCTRLTDASELLLPSMTMDLYCYQSMFNGCTALTSAPALPAMTMTSGCYLEMFKGCSSLTEAPELPATNLGADCYEEMFKGCTSLTEAPELPATDLGHGCYKEMFKGCTSLMEAPELPATTLAGYCYYYMFSNCVSLTEVPSLPATTLTRGCYYGMFNSCTSLTEAPELPATTLAESCYQGMFYNCTSLTSAPELPATTMAKSCYQSMFSWCSNITSAPALPATTLADYCYTQMFYNCTSLTFAPVLPATTLAGHCYSNMFIYCTSLAEASALPATVMADNCYFSMFNGCTSLTSAPALTVMTTASYCCCQMFSGCTGLADASEVSLPAMAMADHCYYNMFCDCRSLTSAPALPATTLADYCYWQMFSNCESLTETPALPATTMAEGCYRSMFNGCESLTEVPALPATMLAESCYQSMFYNCSNLNSTISLPATTLANSCYYKMFYCCHSLKTVITHATTWNAEYAQNWLYDVSATGDFYNLGGADIPRGASGIPEGWTEHTTAPVTITASANNANFGTVSGGGSFVEGETCTLTATPNTNYTFVNWTENNVEVSTDAEYSFTVEADRDLVANFQSSGSGNHWNPDISLYADNMSIVGEIQIDGVTQTSGDIEIGAFCGEEVRGSQRISYYAAPVDKHLVFLTVYGMSNDNITFRLYNHQTESEYDLTAPDAITFTPNATVGGLITPHILNFRHTQSRELTAGWNWYSTFIDIQGEDGFNMLTSGLGEDGLQVKSQSQFALYYPGYDIWTGSLNEADNTKLYMIEMSSPHTLVMTGAFTDVQSTPITINKGWTWIGYPVTESMSLDEATSNINPTNGDYFKSQSGFSIYYEGYGWVGSLNTLEPGRGYMYQNNGESSMSLVYPTPSAKNVLEENITADGNHWVPNAYQYADNMSVIAVININGVEQMSGNLEIGAFSNGECRGSARPIYIEATGRYMLFMTVYGEGGENLDFKLYDADKNEECQLQAGMDFEPNGTVGNLANPYVFDLSVMGIGEEQPFAFGFYPNPVSSGKQLAIEGEYDRIEIINSIGVVIGEYTNTNKIEVTMIPGVYYIRAINDKSVIINKLVVK